MTTCPAQANAQAGHQSPSSISAEMGRNIILFSAAMAKLPPESLGRLQTGPEAMTILAQVIRTCTDAGGDLAWSNGENSQPLPSTAIAPQEASLILQTMPSEVRFEVGQVVAHRSVLSAFDHLLVLSAVGQTLPILICSKLSPLLDPSGLRMLRRHFQRVRDGKAVVAEFHRELHGIAALLHQDDPLGGPHNPLGGGFSPQG